MLLHFHFAVLLQMSRIIGGWLINILLKMDDKKNIYETSPMKFLHHMRKKYYFGDRWGDKLGEKRQICK